MVQTPKLCCSNTCPFSWDILVMPSLQVANTQLNVEGNDTREFTDATGNLYLALREQ